MLESRPKCRINGCNNLAKILYNNGKFAGFDKTCVKHNVDGTIRSRKKPPSGTRCSITGCNFAAKRYTDGFPLCKRHRLDGTLTPSSTSEAVAKRKRKSQWKKLGIDITYEEYEELLKSQNNRCAICGRDFSIENHACCDHNHETGKVRGILCNRCNFLMGCVDEGLIDKAIEYKIRTE